MPRPFGKYERLARERHARDRELAARPGGHSRGLRFDAAAAARVVRFIERYCKHYEGEWGGKPVRLEDWQKDDIIGPVFGWKRADGTRRYRTAYIEIPRKNGKALAVDTPIPTPSGWKTMDDLAAGDAVFDENGAQCEIVAAGEIQTGRPCYRVTFSDGTSVVADAEHEWFTEARRNGLPRTGRGAKSSWRARHIRTTAKIRNTLHAQTAVGKTEWNHRVPCAGGLECEEAKLAVPPYTLGAWLGDGHTDSAALTATMQDAEILDAIRAEGVPVDGPRAEKHGCAVYLLGGKKWFGLVDCFRRRLGRLGVLGNKHIPPQYLRASVAQRLALLRGLMDTDGTVSKAGQCSFTTTLPQLRDDTIELLRSLGFKPSITSRIPTIRGRPQAVCAEAWTIQFWAFAGDEVFGLKRKLTRLLQRPDGRPRSGYRQIIAVDPVPSVPVRCIQVSSPSHLFLAGEGMVPTHNSFLCSALALYLLVSDGEPGAQVYSSATKEEQAAIVWRGASEMVRSSADLARFLEVHGKKKKTGGTIFCERTNSFFRPLGADSTTLDGLNPHAQVVDELHEHKDRRVWDKLDTATGARRQPLTIAITTAGVYDPESIGWQQHKYAQDVLDGAFEDDSYFAFIAAMDEGDDVYDVETQKKANPNHGISAKADKLAEQAAKAQRQPRFYNEYLRYHLNGWTQQAERWLSVEKWRECDPLDGEKALEARVAREAALAGRACCGGLDLSSKIDVASLVLAFALPDDVVELVCRFWLPEATVEENEKKGQRHYAGWVKEGWLTATPGNVIDYGFIEREVVELGKKFTIQEIGFDPWNATQCAQNLEGEGFTTVETRQGYATLSEPSKDLEARIIGLRVRHGGNPVLRWMVGNAVAKKDPAGNIKPDKAKASGKIDGVVATVMALARLNLSEGESVYSAERGFLSL